MDEELLAVLGVQSHVQMLMPARQGASDGPCQHCRQMIVSQGPTSNDQICSLELYLSV